MADKPATLMQVMNYFGFEKGTEFRQEWTAFGQVDRDQLRAGIGNGSFTY